MKNKEYLVLTQNAVEALVSNRMFSSIDFDAARDLVSLFSRGDESYDHVLRVAKLSVADDGVVVISKNEQYARTKNTVTIDLSRVDIRLVDQSAALVAIQKLMRFCVKYWNQYSLNNNEYLPPGSSKAIVFPFPITTGSSYRIVIEREPDSRRASARYDGKHLLVYKFSQSEGEGLKEEPGVSVFRKAMERVFMHGTYAEAIQYQIDSKGQDALHVTQLVAGEKERSAFVDPASWEGHLSNKQLAFVKSDCCVPARIEGPAGSGKTLCVVLKAVYWARKAANSNDSFKALFIVPSHEMARNVSSLLDMYYPERGADANNHDVFINVSTLQDVCAKFLGNDISGDDLLDDDPQESKNTQLLYLADIVEEVQRNIDAHGVFISKDMLSLFKDDDCLRIAELLKHEISVVIKGRANESLEDYLLAKRPTYGLPISTELDRKFVFSLFKKYTEILDKLNQFDVDDVALSVVGRLDAPLWKRRRALEGFDAVFIDEVHLFNLNELSIVHYLTKSPDAVPVSMAVDVTQALGDIAWDDGEVAELIGSPSGGGTKLEAVFRCSPEITNLAFSVTSHGASLFTNFANPLSFGSTVSMDAENGAEKTPKYWLIGSGVDIVEYGFARAERIKDDWSLKRSGIVFVFFERMALDAAIEFARLTHKPVVLLTRRGDAEAIEKARQQNAFVLASVDYVGGLEFDAAILVGVDKGRVPLLQSVTSVANRQFQSYVAHNRVYVAVTRARKIVDIIGEEMRGESDVLSSAIKNNHLVVEHVGLTK